MDGKVELIARRAGAFADEVRKLDTADATVVIVDIDPGSEADFTALNALTQRLGGMPPVIVAIPAFDVSLARQLLQMRVADFVVKPVQPLDLVRACARAAQGAQNGGGTTEAKIYTFLPAAGGVGLTTLAIETAMLLLKGEGGQKTNDLPGRSRFPARLVLRLSRSRTAPRSRRDRAAPGPARPATARSDDVRASVRPEGDRGAEPPGRDALVRFRSGDAAARSRRVAFRQRRDRRAAHLVRLDRQRADRLEPAVPRHRDDRAGAQARAPSGQRDPRAAARRAAARR